ncbi:MAG: fatty acid desaturase [Segetibacter sp.]|nr:fatty acid desaturase [Segetibacter sp.]
MAIVITDPIYNDTEKRSIFESFVLKFINDKRDMPFIYLSLKITLIVLPFALYLFLDKNIHWLFYIAYLGIFFFFLGPYILMLHNTCHRKLFKKKYAYLTKYSHWFLGLFFGQTPETYFHHHIAMHHPENNLVDDLSSTMIYQRDSLRSFSKYLISFYFFGILDLAAYFKKRNRKKFAWKVLVGEWLSIVLIILLSFYNFKATLTVFIAPIIITRFAMMAGNWAQHAFIDPQNPADIYKNSITCINTVYNKKCFNDGYHIGHHLRPSLHWTEMPKDFLQNIEKYKQNEVVIFAGLDYFQIWFLLMIKNYKYLSKKFVCLSDTGVPNEKIVAFLKSRTRKIIDI